MKNEIINLFNGEGITEVGFCDFSLVADKLLNCRAKGRIPKNSKTIITCLFPYKVHETPPILISRYAAVPDYHNICGEYLTRICNRLGESYPQNNFAWFIDNSPIPEVATAAFSGLGVVGENSLLINEKYGSYCFIGEIVTDLNIETTGEIKYCIKCGKCKKHCPKEQCGGCLSDVSQLKRELTVAEKQALRDNNILWGCDICSEVCPMNNGKELTNIPEFIDGYRNSYEEGEDIKGRAYAWRGEKVIKRNFENLSARK